MMTKKKYVSRRSFIKGIGIVSVAMPWLPQTILAQVDETEKKKGNFYRVLTCNIRVALPEDEKKGYGWNTRKKICKEVIAAHSPDIICLQEVIRVQIEDLKKYFPGFSSFGFEGPSMDAYPEGYHWIAKNPILFSKSRYKLTSAGSYWLSETPLIAGSKSWNTARARQANWVRLKDRNTHKEFRVVNTHLDHLEQGAREKQIELIIKESAQYLTDFPQLLTGDFNSHIPNPIFETIKAGGWTDTFSAVHGDADPGFTYHNFKGSQFVAQKKGYNKIDFIFTKGNLKSKDAKIIKDNINGVYPSDHYFVSADLQIL